MKIKLTISYDGTNYCGWQKQKNGISVQEVIENALSSLVGEKIKIIGSGRTDAGVHAEGQVASFSTKKENIPPEKYAFALNSILPPDIKILDSKLVEDNFNACTSAKKKTYQYSFYCSQIELPLKERYSTRIYPMVNVDKMKKASELFIGERDFKNYCSTGGNVKTTVRTIYSLVIENVGDQIILKVTGNGFLYNMVRISAGTLLDVGYDKIALEQIENSFSEKGTKARGRTLPAKALKLLNVEY